METEKLLTGAEVFAKILQEYNVKYVFAYPGTSELALCDALLKTKDITLINGQGDKESAFMAAGGNLLSPMRSVAILHGARGSTNALGAIADAQRNEIGTVFFIGLPSTSSAPFLPPHGEHNLIQKIGSFVKNSYDITENAVEKDSAEERKRKAQCYIDCITKAIVNAKKLPIGPTIVGIPQDIAEYSWIPNKLLKNLSVDISESLIDQKLLQKAVDCMKNKKYPVILIDDYLYKTPYAKWVLAKFSNALVAPILQIRYTRGPMLFERLTYRKYPLFAGPYTPSNKMHKKIMNNADILITIEDRNGYKRVIGSLPSCQKIAITSNPEMTKKNKYLRKDDILISGNVATIMQRMLDQLPKVKSADNKHTQKLCKIAYKQATKKSLVDKKYTFMRTFISEQLAEIFRKIENPVLVDDSQMFGGLLAENYDLFPSKLRVFGDHGGFIGGGLVYANGLARCNKQITVFCTLGDQSYTNAIQGLIVAIQEKIKIIYIICNNSCSVSLLKQMFYQDSTAFFNGKNSFLYNVPQFSYTKLANSLGITTFTIRFDPESNKKELRNPQSLLKNALINAIVASGPVLLELILPSSPEAWKGIWAVKGNENK